jgi:hypothetical protein
MRILLRRFQTRNFVKIRPVVLKFMHLQNTYEVYTFLLCMANHYDFYDPSDFDLLSKKSNFKIFSEVDRQI